MSSHSDLFAASGSSQTQREEIPSPPDFLLENHFSIFLIRPISPAAFIWVEQHLPSDKAKPAGNPTIAHLLGFEAEDGAVSLRARESAQSTGFETLLIAAECSGRVAEAARYIVLIRVSRLEKLNHGVGFG
jgi:hypothetical protein